MGTIVRRRPHYRKSYMKRDGTKVSGGKVSGTKYFLKGRTRVMEKTKEITTFGLNAGIFKIEHSIERKPQMLKKED